MNISAKYIKLLINKNHKDITPRKFPTILYSNIMLNIHAMIQQL